MNDGTILINTNKICSIRIQEETNVVYCLLKAI